MEQKEFDDLNNRNNLWKKSRRTSWAVPVAIVAVLALVGVSVWGYFQNKQLNDLKIAMENQYSRAFVDLTDYVDNVEVMLAKSLVTSTPQTTSSMLEEVWRQANLAQTNMGELPVSPPVLEKTSNFLTQAGDLAYALNTKTMNGSPISDSEYKNLEKLHGFAVSLQKSLHGIEDQINKGKMVWGSAGGPRQMKSTSSKYSQTSQFENIDKNFQEYPSMVYDGPYSDHMMKTKPVGLKSGKVSVSEAQNIARKLIGNDRIQNVTQLENNDSEESIKTYRFKVTYKNQKDDEDAEVDITQQGGQVYWMLRNRPVTDGKVTMEAARKAAEDFLKKNGFSDMKETYYMRTDGMATICYAYIQDGAKVYPDLVKVKVALDNSEILGIEAKGYLYNHKTRDIPAAKFTMEEARSIINDNLNIETQGRAIIPTDFKTEKYCYEFQGKIGEQKYIIYINAVTGKEEDILMLIDTGDGTLTM